MNPCGNISPFMFGLRGLHRFNILGFKPGLKQTSAAPVYRKSLCECGEVHWCWTPG